MQADSGDALVAPPRISHIVRLRFPAAPRYPGKYRVRRLSHTGTTLKRSAEVFSPPPQAPA